MLILMLASRYGSEDGFTLRYFRRGGAYRVSYSLAAEMIRRGDATIIF